MSAVDVSVMICTWNNASRLSKTLAAISRCAVPAPLPWELVLVNNNCTDETPRVAGEAARRLPLRYVEEPRQGLSRARNAGLAAASGRLIVFTDDDVIPCDGWIATYWEVSQEKPAGFYFGGPLVSEYETGTVDASLLRVASPSLAGLSWGPRAGLLAPHQRFMGANWACPADAVGAAGGFDVRLGLDASLGRRRVGEEFDLMDRLWKLGLRPWYLPQARVVHFVPRTKCTLEYAAANAEASGIHSVSSETLVPFLHARPRLHAAWAERRRLLGGIPPILYRKTVALAIRWLFARARKDNGYEEYLSLRFCIGMMKGFRQRRPGQRGQINAPLLGGDAGLEVR